MTAIDSDCGRHRYKRDIYDKIKNINKSMTCDTLNRHFAIILPSDKKAGWNDKISFGQNSNTTWNYMYSRHAEFDAINKIKHKKNMPSQIDIFVIRFSKTGLLGQSKPCFHCVGLMKRARLNIKYIYYSTDKNTIVKERFDTICDGIYDDCYISTGMKKKNRLSKL